MSAGAVQTLMSVDADRVVNLCVSLHELWSLPAQIAIALYLLYTQVKCSDRARLFFADGTQSSPRIGHTWVCQLRSVQL